MNDPDVINTDEKQDVHLAFNKISGAFLGVIIGAAELDETYLKYRKVRMNPAMETWQGDYDTGKIVSKEAQPAQISEFVMDATCNSKIGRKYQPHHQLNIMGDLLDAVVSQSGLLPEDHPALVAFHEMRKYIAAVRANNKRLKEAYLEGEHYNYRSKEDMIAVQDAELEGGLAHVVGRDGYDIKLQI